MRDRGLIYSGLAIFLGLVDLPGLAQPLRARHRQGAGCPAPGARKAVRCSAGVHANLPHEPSHRLAREGRPRRRPRLHRARRQALQHEPDADLPRTMPRRQGRFLRPLPQLRGRFASVLELPSRFQAGAEERKMTISRKAFLRLSGLSLSRRRGAKSDRRHHRHALGHGHRRGQVPQAGELHQVHRRLQPGPQCPVHSRPQPRGPLDLEGILRTRLPGPGGRVLSACARRRR